MNNEVLIFVMYRLILGKTSTFAMGLDIVEHMTTRAEFQDDKDGEPLLLQVYGTNFIFIFQAFFTGTKRDQFEKNGAFDNRQCNESPCDLPSIVERDIYIRDEYVGG